MAPPPEYDKEPKAPDKTGTSISTEDTKHLHNQVNDQHQNSDHLSLNAASTTEAENKHVETLDDGQLRALLDEAITYKCPKDREGKSSLFKELLEEVEQDEQACEEAARTLDGCRGARRGGRGRRALPHSNSLQDLVAALAAEPAPRRAHVRQAAPQHAHATVSARATHGGSLPSGVDTSSLSEEPARGGYLATVRCVNPPPLAERRVSASDANGPGETEPLNRRSKPMFPMTYTARATLEIGSGSVCSGRAVTTTTPSNQVRKPPTLTPYSVRDRPPWPTTCGPPHKIYTKPRTHEPNLDDNQMKLLRALFPRADEGGGRDRIGDGEVMDSPRGPTEAIERLEKETGTEPPRAMAARLPEKLEQKEYPNDTQQWVNSVENWYKGLSTYYEPTENRSHETVIQQNTLNKHDKKIDLEKKESHPNEQVFKNIESRDKDKECNGCVVNPNNYLQSIDPKGSQHKIISCPHNRKLVCKQNIVESQHSNYNNMKNTNKTVNRVFEESICDNAHCDISLRKKYRERVGRDLQVPKLSATNPRNVRNMTIGSPSHSVRQNPKPDSLNTYHSPTTTDTQLKPIREKKANKSVDNFIASKETNEICKSTSENSNLSNSNLDNVEFNMVKIKSPNLDIELSDVTCQRPNADIDDSFSLYVAKQQKLFEALEAPDLRHDSYETKRAFQNCHVTPSSSDKMNCVERSNENSDRNEISIDSITCKNETDNENIAETSTSKNDNHRNVTEKNEIVIKLNKNSDDSTSGDRYILAELPNNAYVFLTLPNHLLTSLNGKDEKSSLRRLREIENNNNVQPCVDDAVEKTVKKKKGKVQVAPFTSSSNKKREINKNALKVLLFENQLKSSSHEKSASGKPGASSGADEEVDSAISFSCITTPEVVATCNTTSSTTQAAVVVDPKPLQLGSSYRAVASVTGAETRPPAGVDPAPGTDPAPEPDPDPAPGPAPSQDPSTPLPSRAQPRGVISSTFNGLPLSRASYGAAPAAGDDYKKSLDENGNSVQGFSSPLSGSSQHKKPRRKKVSNKNETLIDCQQIDGYQGDKDVNELLRFIESNADGARGAKLGRVKHKDDADDKGGKKRSAERRKDKETKVKRATSMEELSRTKMEDLTHAPEMPRRAEHAPAKPERRSWGDDAPPSAAELTDFQTVTKKRRPRRRADDAPGRRVRPPEPRARRESAPPSDRSNDSNDDLDSVHSLPPAPAPAPPAPHASYADIARTRHNIPDLIESCNFYAEGEARPAPADDYPALERRPVAPRRERKERAPPAPAAPDCPAPDVVADRRPPVVLLDSAARPRDMDGVTFGFDVNEQLLGDGAGRPRCDLLREAVAGSTGAGGPAVRVGCRALRYVPPAAPHDAAHLMHIVDYVGNAWEDVVRCGAGKVRYFNE